MDCFGRALPTAGDVTAGKATNNDRWTIRRTGMAMGRRCRFHTPTRRGRDAHLSLHCPPGSNRNRRIRRRVCHSSPRRRLATAGGRSTTASAAAPAPTCGCLIRTASTRDASWTCRSTARARCDIQRGHRSLLAASTGPGRGGRGHDPRTLRAGPHQETTGRWCAVSTPPGAAPVDLRDGRRAHPGR